MKHAYIDRYSDIDSLIHRLDPRVKIISFFIFILFVLFTRSTSFHAFALYGVLIAVLILLSKIDLEFIFKRSLVIVPFVLVVTIFRITYDGLTVFWNCFIKAYLSILCMILLMASTKFSDLIKSFEKLKLPRLITMILSFMYRYIFVVQDELMKMRQAKEARSIGGSSWFHAKALANMIGNLFIKSYERAESVYLAMCSRGFDGNVRTIDDFKLKGLDLFFFLAMIVLLTSIRLIGD